MFSLQHFVQRILLLQFELVLFQLLVRFDLNIATIQSRHFLRHG